MNVNAFSLKEQQRGHREQALLLREQCEADQ
jgi:hypothetical protein